MLLCFDGLTGEVEDIVIEDLLAQENWTIRQKVNGYDRNKQ